MRGLLAAATRIAFRSGASLRGARAFHPRGVAYRGAAVVGPAAPSGFPQGSFDAVVRLSRGVGLPDALPDVHGVAVKLLDACGTGCDQDLLLASAGSAPVTRHLLRPARTFAAGLFSTILPYDTADGPRVVAARFARPTPGRFGALDTRVGAGDVRIDLLAAPPGGDWVAIGHVDLAPGRLVDDDERALSFDPWHTAATFVPTGTLNRLRRPAYNASRQGRPAGLDHRPEPGRP